MSPSLILAALAVASLFAGWRAAAGPTDTSQPSWTLPSSSQMPQQPDRSVGIDDGEAPDGLTVFDGRYAAVTRLDHDLLQALRSASRDAGIEFDVGSGWRSEQYQRRLFEQAVARYGSVDEAARWVARPGTSVHEQGDAVDISNVEATRWLSANGAAYGLCQVYANEPWHFELRPSAIGGGCPTMYADATNDPRMRR